MSLSDPYELTPFTFYMDVVLPCLPGVGLMAIAIGLIDMGTDIESVQTQGKVRVTAGVVSHTVYLLMLVLLAAV